MHAFDRQTDRRTDGQTDRIPIAIPRLHSMQRGNKIFSLGVLCINAAVTEVTNFLNRSKFSSYIRSVTSVVI